MSPRLLFTLAFGGALFAAEPSPDGAPVAAVMDRFCLKCHDSEVSKGGLNLEKILPDALAAHPETWENVVRRLRARQMPPARKERPEEKDYVAVLAALESTLDREAAAHPKPGRTETIRRMNRAEYQNAIRDLLDLDIDAAALLPADESSHGFDNVTVGTLSPTLLDRYISAAQKISRLAVGASQREPGGDTIRIKPEITQEEQVEGLPFGTRGGARIAYTFPRDGEYEIQIRLTRDRNEHVEGLKEEHQLVVLLDRAQVQSLGVKPPGGAGHEHVDDHLKFRVPVEAGPHDLGVTFLKNPSSLPETLRQPYNAHFNTHRHPRLSPAIFQVSITGPFDPAAAANPGPSQGNSPSRRRIFLAHPNSPGEEEGCARRILSTLMRRAYRRPVTDEDLARPLDFFRAARTESDFESGIEAALSAILVSREFLFRVEQQPLGLAPGAPYAISDIELASRLSFFLWSSIPDEELLAVAERRELHQPAQLEKQTRRMLADARAKSLVRNFAGQWLHLRNLDSMTPDGRLFADFDDNLRQSMRRETELHFEEMLREDRSVLELLRSDHTFLNERLARHYGIAHIYGTGFRRVELDAASQRGGLLRQASVLMVTSYATRTSPVVRGKWVLENLIGTPPPPPAPDVPALDDNTVAANLPVRARLASHRANAACASCHDFMDPVGLALENYDAVGRWRTLEEGQPVDASGGLPDGSVFTGVSGLEDAMLRRPEVFASNLAGKLLTFGLGRGVEPGDGPAIREIVRRAQAQDYRFSAIIVGLVQSPPFTLRASL